MSTNIVAVILEEYRALRAEVILCLERRTTIISWGLAAIGAIFAAAVAAYTGQKPLMAGVLLLAIATTTSWLVLNMWLTETRRARRASHYLCYLEIKLMAVMGTASHPKPLEWEQQLRKPKTGTQFSEHYIHTIGFFGFMLFVSTYLGTLSTIEALPILITSRPKDVASIQAHSEVIAAILAASIAFIVFQKAMGQARWLKEEFQSIPEYPPKDA